MNVAGLPHDKEGTLALDGCELNERLDPVSRLAFNATKAEAVRTVLAVAITAAVLGVVPRLVSSSLGPLVLDSLLWFAAGFAALSGFHFLCGSRSDGHFFWMSLTFVVLWTVVSVQVRLPSAAAGYQVLFAAGLLGTAALSHLVAKQYVYYTAANILNDWATGNVCRGAWQSLELACSANWRANDPPEVASYRRAAVGLLPAYVAGLVAAQCGLPGAVGYIVALAVAAFFTWPTGTDPDRVFIACGHAVRVFLTYDRAASRAPGVFRFPTRWLRPWRRRGVVTLAVFTLLSASFATELPPERPPQTLQSSPADPDCPATTDEEREYLAGVSDSEDRSAYCQVLKERRLDEARIHGEIQDAYDRTLLRAVVASLLAPLLVFAATFVFLTGPLLAACDVLERRGND